MVLEAWVRSPKREDRAPVMELAEEHDVYADRRRGDARISTRAAKSARRLSAPAARPPPESEHHGVALMATPPRSARRAVLRAGDRPLDWGREREMNAVEA